jgi:hypothetical protein
MRARLTIESGISLIHGRLMGLTSTSSIMPCWWTGRFAAERPISDIEFIGDFAFLADTAPKLEVGERVFFISDPIKFAQSQGELGLAGIAVIIGDEE